MGLVNNFKQGDPFILRSVEVPGGDLKLQVRIMAEEYRDFGTPRCDLLKMFSDSYYAGLYVLYIRLGEKVVVDIIDDVYKNIPLAAVGNNEIIHRRNDD